jgi:hypothetical protein
MDDGAGRDAGVTKRDRVRQAHGALQQRLESDDPSADLIEVAVAFGQAEVVLKSCHLFNTAEVDAYIEAWQQWMTP